MSVQGPDAVSEESVGPGVDHVVLESRQVDHSPVFVIGDRQVSYQRHLVSVEWTAVNLVGS